MRVKLIKYIISVFMLSCCVVCIWRICFPEISKNLSDQYAKDIIVSYPRGTIYDRNAIAMTNRRIKGYEFLDLSDSSLNISPYLTGEINCDKDSVKSQQCHGVSGLEQCYDEILSGGSPITVSAYVDAKGNILEDSGYYVENAHPNEGGNITLCLDCILQQNCEQIMKEFASEYSFEKMSAIISDVNTSEILAMPSYGGYMNNAMLTYQPGSVMKIITAAVAYEMGVIDENSTYECTGTVYVDGEQRHCCDNAVHGNLTMAEAFAVSCNCCFYEMAKKLTYTDEEGNLRSYVLDRAKQWGFSEYETIPQNRFLLEYDDHYSFVCSDIFNNMDIFNATLGQGRIQASAYTIHAITAAIAAGGTTIKPYIVSSIKDAANNVIKTEEKIPLCLNLTPKTISWLKEAMVKTGSVGTASSNTLEEYGGLAGKTGTAENNEGCPAHAWFTGYFPANEAKYAVTVVIEQGISGGNAVKLADKLARLTIETYR